MNMKRKLLFSHLFLVSVSLLILATSSQSCVDTSILGGDFFSSFHLCPLSFHNVCLQTRDGDEWCINNKSLFIINSIWLAHLLIVVLSLVQFLVLDCSWVETTRVVLVVLFLAWTLIGGVLLLKSIQEVWRGLDGEVSTVITLSWSVSTVVLLLVLWILSSLRLVMIKRFKTQVYRINDELEK